MMKPEELRDFSKKIFEASLDIELTYAEINSCYEIIKAASFLAEMIELKKDKP